MAKQIYDTLYGEQAYDIAKSFSLKDGGSVTILALATLNYRDVEGRSKISVSIEPVVNESLLLLSLKYLICRHIDWSWGDGDVHLENLKFLLTIDPKDEIVRKLFEALERSSNLYKETMANPENLEKWKQDAKEFEKNYGSRYPSIEDCYAESVYRDAGKDEADFFLQKIIDLYGKEKAEMVEDLEL